jgi:hypothetical protein
MVLFLLLMARISPGMQQNLPVVEIIEEESH